jgi:hypothetical protein
MPTLLALSANQRRLLVQVSRGEVIHRTCGIEAFMAPNVRGYRHRVNRTAESLLRAGLIERGTKPLGDPRWPFYYAVLTDAGRAALANFNHDTEA